MSTVEPGTDRLLVAELVGLLNDAEHYGDPCSTPDSRLDYLDRRAALLHRLVDAFWLCSRVTTVVVYDVGRHEESNGAGSGRVPKSGQPSAPGLEACSPSSRRAVAEV
ncbi:hypothetical protein ACIA8I_41975 [Streptomyces rishiriensis]|uniref:hypothetical protein n=1 Tax=Streptomyces rishiriensis TaxID=68264 RepID=UPI00378CB444